MQLHYQNTTLTLYVFFTKSMMNFNTFPIFCWQGNMPMEKVKDRKSELLYVLGRMYSMVCQVKTGYSFLFTFERHEEWRKYCNRQKIDFEFFYGFWFFITLTFWKSVCQCVSVCQSVRRRTWSLNQSTDLVQNRYLASSLKYPEPFFLNENFFRHTMYLKFIGNEFTWCDMKHFFKTRE